MIVPGQAEHHTTPKGLGRGRGRNMVCYIFSRSPPTKTKYCYLTSHFQVRSGTHSDKSLEFRTSSHETLTGRSRMTRVTTSDHSRIRTFHKSWGIIQKTSKSTEMKTAFLWHVLSSNLVGRYLCFQGHCCSYLQGRLHVLIQSYTVIYRQNIH